MYKRKILCGAGMTALCSIPLLQSEAKAYEPRKYTPETHYVVNMGISYCMHVNGGWSLEQSAQWYHDRMSKDGFSRAMTKYLHQRHQPKVAGFIKRQGGCPALASQMINPRSTNRRNPQPTAPSPVREVLNDTPFYF